MSHSDSEVNRCRTESKRKLHVEFKAKNVNKNLTKFKSKLWTSQIKAEVALRPIRDRLISAVCTNNTELLSRELEAGGNPNVYDPTGRGALHIAVSKGYGEVVRLLLEKGANANAKDVIGNTPLHLAACTHNLQIISLLLKAGANVKKQDVYGKNALQIAESKLQLLHRSWRKGSIEMLQVRAELELITDILISVGKSQAEQTTKLPELEMMKMSLQAGNVDNVDDQMCKLLNDLQSFKLA